VVELLTMSDLRFLPQLLVLHRSLERHGSGVSLVVLTMDEVTHEYLRSASLPGVRLVGLRELEQADRELAERRGSRSWTEYCWTAAPAFCRLAVTSAAPASVQVWVDADVEFERDPALLLQELGSGSVLLTPHRYVRAYPVAAPAAWLTRRYGRFNGGTIAFRADARGRAAADVWRRRSLEWCHNRCEPGRFGNQLYLDELARELPGVRVAAVPGVVLGPWNGGGFRVVAAADGPTADGAPVIAYHYQSLSIGCRSVPGLHPPSTFGLGAALPTLEARAAPHYRLGAAERRLFWGPHAVRLGHAVDELLAGLPAYGTMVAPASPVTATAREWGRHWRLEASRVREPTRRQLRDWVDTIAGTAAWCANEGPGRVEELLSRRFDRTRSGRR
jgi:hypothetical protein